MTLKTGVYLEQAQNPHSLVVGPFKFTVNDDQEMLAAIHRALDFAKANYEPHEVVPMIVVDNLGWGNSAPPPPPPPNE